MIFTFKNQGEDDPTENHFKDMENQVKEKSQSKDQTYKETEIMRKKTHEV